jgi:hypothetical protein
MALQKYGLAWPDGADALQIEFAMIRRIYFGADKKALTKHYLSCIRLIWPEDMIHRWLEVGLKSIVENKCSVFLGSASSGKTNIIAYHALIDFWCFPQTSFGIVSSTDKRALEQKVWGRIKGLFNRGRARHPWLEGYVLESSQAITPDDIDDDNEVARTLDRGIACVPCVSGGRFVGMGKFQGAKAPNSPGKYDGILKHYGDEAAVMQTSFLDAYTNWTVSPNFKGVMCGNPTDISDPLCIAAEPVGGWDSFVDTGKTQEWTSGWYAAHVVAFDGRDSPNNDQPGTKYPFLISREFIDALRTTHGDDSWQLFQQGIGKPSKGMVSNRVITMGLCERNKAFEDVIWLDGKKTSLYSVDPAYGTGDRCVGTFLEFGLDKDGRQILNASVPEIIPIKLNAPMESEEQIAEFIFRKLKNLNIPPENCFYDSVGKGTLGNAFAKLFGFTCPVPVDSGMKATARPVRLDLFVPDKASSSGMRLKRCDEHYSKFVTEMWHSVRELVEGQQLRNLPRQTANEGQLRLYSIVTGNRIEVESKDDMKDRIKKSPDLFDCLAIGVEGARRLGFKIQRLGSDVAKEKPKANWFQKQSKELAILNKSKQLSAR